MSKRSCGFLAGILFFVLILLAPLPPGLSAPAKSAGAVALLMAVWWITDAMPLGMTALLPLVLYPLLSVMKASETTKHYADPNVFLLMGGFMIALAMQKWGLHKRLALHVICSVGGGLRRMLGGFMLATAFISMWVSNTAATMMALPIAIAVIQELGLGQAGAEDRSGFSIALMLAIAYAASIGGAATLVGTPTNMVFAGQAKALFPDLPEVGFVKWFILAFPLAFGFLAIAWLYLAFFVVRRALPICVNQEAIRKEVKALGPWSWPEAAVMGVFVATALAWITRENIAIGNFVIPGWTSLLHLKGVHDGTIAMAAGLLLLLIPGDLKRKEFLLDREWTKKLPWEVILLLGGGLALAESFQATGLASWLGEGFRFLQGMPLLWLLFLLCLLTAFLSELMTNVAQATIMMPVLAAASQALGIHPYWLMVPVTFACSFAFMMPSGTPPNAIVFSSGYLTVSRMAKAGFVLNILGALWITFAMRALAPLVFGLRAF
ncbi:MAG: SLC13/DASS family transporter [Candidatus Omnitrophica bacterium]|nr:SLC13/DASS family transporter [Candidatus Omnitrophota bacterium]